MDQIKKIRRFWIVVGALLVVVFVAILLWHRWYWFFPSKEVSEMYSKYEHVDGINAAYVQAYRVNDTVTVDVTLLQAVSDTGWTILQRDFNLPIIPKEVEALFNGDSNKVSTKYINKKDPASPVDTVNVLNNNTVIISRPKRTLCIFTINDTTQLKAITRYGIDNNISPKTTKHLFTND